MKNRARQSENGNLQKEMLTLLKKIVIMGALVVEKKRKNIDIPIDTFRNLSIRAASEGRSLKSFIENLLIIEAKTMSDEELYHFLVKNKQQREKYLNETEQNEAELADYLGETDKLEYEQLKNAFLNGSKRSMSQHISKFIE